MTTFRPGLLLISLSALGHILGPPLADFNETHVKNPRWPPHAKFHNGQTMTMGVGLGFLILYYTWRAPKRIGKSEDLWTAALIGTLYYGAGLTAVYYPGSKAMDPEFLNGRHEDVFPQYWVFVAHLVANWAGWGLERFGVWGGKGKSE